MNIVFRPAKQVKATTTPTNNDATKPFVLPLCMVGRGKDLHRTVYASWQLYFTSNKIDIADKKDI